jgi:hypothetical protein
MMANQYTTVSPVALNSATPTLLAAAVDIGRGYTYFQNDTAIDVYISTDSGVTTSGPKKGIRLVGGLTPPAEFTDAVGSSAWYGIAASATPSLTVAICKG